MHTVLTAYVRQAPAPSQVPSVPQDAAPLSAHWASGSLPAGTFVHVPRLPWTAHERQVPLHALAQQMPCWHMPELQSPSDPQTAPIGAFPQLLFVHTLPGLQSASVLHVVRHWPVVPHMYGSQGWPELALAGGHVCVEKNPNVIVVGDFAIAGLAAVSARGCRVSLFHGRADEAFTDDGCLKEVELRERYVEILDELVSLAEQTEDSERGAHSR